MSGRSSSQVNNLRAMFEQNKESISPPSRGRSPAGLDSITDNKSRPLSKVRTSFVAVERSGQMGPSLDNKMNRDGQRTVAGDSGNELKPNEDGNTDLTMIHGNGIVPEPSEAEAEKKSPEEAKRDANGAPEPEAPSHDELKPALADHADASVGESISETKDENENAQVSGSERNGNMEASKPAENLGDLGVVMKGASFEEDGEQKFDGSGDMKVKSPKPTSSSLTQTQSSSDITTSGPSKDRAPTKKSTMPKEKPIPSRPSAISTKRGSQPVSTATGTTPSGPLKKSPKTPTSPNMGGRQPSSKTTSPRQLFSSKFPSNTSKEPKKMPAQTSGTSKAQATKTGQTASSTNGSLVKRPNPTLSSVKARPKSPTRPVRLPAGATAPTAASAAKLGDVPPSRSPSRAGAANTGRPSALHGERPAAISRDLASGTSANLRKSSRPSLPAPSTTIQKPKARISTSSSKAPESSFLARMMRPTQSSASKTHEKVELGSPPSKSHSVKPKRKSNAADEEKGNTVGESGPAPAHQGDEQTNTSIAEGTSVENGVTSVEASSADLAPTQ